MPQRGALARSLDRRGEVSAASSRCIAADTTDSPRCASNRAMPVRGATRAEGGGPSRSRQQHRLSSAGVDHGGLGAGARCVSGASELKSGVAAPTGAATASVMVMSGGCGSARSIAPVASAWPSSDWAARKRAPRLSRPPSRSAPPPVATSSPGAPPQPCGEDDGARITSAGCAACTLGPPAAAGG